MRELLPALAFCFVSMFSSSIEALAQTALGIRRTQPQTIEVSWPSSAGSLVLYESESLGNAADWKLVNVLPILNGGQYSILLSTSGRVRFFRLAAPALATIEQTSPRDGETEVAVTRETIVHLTSPLSAESVVSTTNLFATFAGRRLLSRVEVSTDRRRVTLFYLEPLPGSARGLEMPIVITVQTDGALNFDRPAPVCFPNLSGGRLEIAGTMEINNLFRLAAGTLARANLIAGGAINAIVQIVNYAYLDGVTLNGDLTIEPGTLYVLNGLTLNSTLTLASAGGNSAILRFEGGPQSLLGNGQVVFGGVGTANYVYSTGSGGLTIGPGITIRGASGFIGDGSQPLINQGTILAEVAGKGMAISGRFTNQGVVEGRSGAIISLEGTWSNTGTLRVNDSILQLKGNFTTAGIGQIERSGGAIKIMGTVDNTGSTLALNATSGSWALETGLIKGGVISLSGGAILEVVSYGSWDGVTLSSDLSIEAATLYVLNGLTLNSTLTLANASGTSAILRFDGGPQSLLGNGQVVFGGAGTANYVYSTGTGGLTIGPGITIRGASGFIGDGSQPLINQGTILAEVAGKGMAILGRFTNQGVVEGRSGAIIALEGTWSNTGTLRVNDSILQLKGKFTTADLGQIERSGGSIKIMGTLDNTGSTLALNAPSGSWVLETGVIKGGNISLSGGATLQLVSHGYLDGVTLSSDLSIEAATLYILNGLTLNSTLTLANASGTSAILRFEGGPQSLLGNGQVVFGGVGTANYVYSTGSGGLTIGPGITIRGASGFIGDGSQPLINQGTILAEVAGKGIAISGRFTNQGVVEGRSGAIIALEGTWSNTGTLRVNDSILQLKGNFTTADIGQIERSGGSIKIMGTVDNTGSTLALNATSGSWALETGLIKGGVISLSGGAILQVVSYGSWDGVTLSSDLSIEAATLYVLNGLTLNSTLTLANASGTSAILRFEGGPQSLLGNGQVVFGGVGTANYVYSTGSGGLTIGPGITIRGASGFIGDSSQPLINQGTIIADGAGSIITIRANPFTNNGSTQELNGGKIAINP